MTTTDAATIASLVPADLHMSSADRLLLVAKIIEARPDLWDQRHFTDGELDHFQKGVPLAAAVSPKVEWRCGTTACIAGWATVCSPVDAPQVFKVNENDVEEIGQVALGFSDDLAGAVFFTIDNAGPWMIQMLRDLAELPEPRTLADARRLGYLKEELK